MSADTYLQNILTREAVDTGVYSPVRGVQTTLEPRIREWAGNFLSGVSPSGSFAKGTANRSGTDIDLFISLSSDTTETLNAREREHSGGAADDSRSVVDWCL